MRRPLVVWTALLAAGIIAQGWIDAEPSTWVFLVASLGVAVRWLARRGGMYGLLVALLLVAVGGWWHARMQLSLRDGLDAYIDAGPVLMSGVVVQMPDEGVDRSYYVLRVSEVEASGDGPGRKEGLRARVRLTVPGPRRFEYGDVLRVRALLERPQGAANPGAFDYKAFLARQRITATAYVPFPRHATVVGHRMLNPFLHWASRIRGVLLRALHDTLPDTSAPLMAGIALGHRRGLSTGVEDDFRRAGLSHLLAVSGMHVGFLAGACVTLCRLLRLPRGFSAALAVVLVWMYVLVAGARPPAVRAGVAVTFGLASAVGGPRADPSTALAAAALILMTQNPLVLYEPSFQLSFAATAAIVTAYPTVRAGLLRRRWPAFLASAVALAASAQWGVLPLVARSFYEVSTVGLVAGLLAAPLVALLVPAGIVTALLHYVWPWGAREASRLVHGVAETLQHLSQTFAGVPWSSVAVPRPSAFLIGATWCFGTLIVRGKNWSPRRRRQIGAWTAVLLAIHVWGAVLDGASGLEIIALDVGQGDALFIRTPAGVTAFIDGGGYFQPPDGSTDRNPGTDVLIPYLRYRGMSRVDVVINTHPHEDHLQGLVAVLENVPVGLAVDGGQNWASPTWDRYIRVLDDKAIRRHVVRPGDVIWIGTDTRLEVLHPPESPMTGTRSDVNNNSVVLRLVHGETSALLTGDIETEAQLHLLRTGARLQADVVKVPHHGSRLGLVSAFYEAVGAQVAIVTVGRNSHGHPSPEVVSVLHRLGAAVYRTDVHGAVRLLSDGRRWTVHTTRDVP